MENREETVQVASQDSKSKPTRSARGLFPRLSLSKTLELPQAIFALGEGENVGRKDVFDRLQRQPDSGSSRALISTSNTAYKLTTGGKNATYMALTELGRRIVNPSDEMDKYSAIYDVLFENDIFNAFMNYWSGKSLPNDAAALPWLHRNCSLSDDDAKICFRVIRENVVDFGLVEQTNGRQVVIPRDKALDNFQNLSNQTDENGGDRSSPTPPNSGVIDSHLQGDELPIQSTSTNVVPEIHFDVQIHLPADASSETYNDIFKSIATHLLGRAKE